MSNKLVKSSNFIRAAKKFVHKHPDFAIELNDTLQTLMNDMFDNKLKTHKLKGEMKEFWACSINYDYRISFQLVKAINEETGEAVDAILLTNIGTHDEVY